MANEIKTVDAGVIVDASVKPNYNKNLGDKIIKISIKVRKAKAGSGNVFKSVKGLKYVEVITDGKSEGKKNRWLDVHFMKKAFTNECCVHSVDELTTGFLYVKAKCVQSPRKYEIVEETDEDGNIIYESNGEAKLVYPSIWIRDDGIVGFEAYVSDQDEFDYHEPVIEGSIVKVDEESGEIIEDEDDAKEVNL